MNKINLKIISLSGIVFDGKAISVTLPSGDGQITVYANHTPFISVLASGTVSVKNENEKTDFKISDGVLEIRYGSKVFILADKVEEITN